MHPQSRIAIPAIGAIGVGIVIIGICQLRA
jgi:hypothetical protein